MKTQKSTLRLAVVAMAIIGWGHAIAQIPSGNEGINYQAIARDGLGDVMVSTALTVTVDIKSGDPIPASVYTETHAVVTNAYGQFSLMMGSGTPTLGTFDAIDWDLDKHWYGISIFDGSTTVVLPDAAFQAVPYAHEASPNSLDQAYDEEGMGAGRIIEVDEDAVRLEVDGGNDGLVIVPQIDGSGTILDVGLKIDATAGTSGAGMVVELGGTSTGDAILVGQAAGASGNNIEITNHGTGDGIEINNTDGIGLEIANSGNDGSVDISQSLATNPADAVEIDNAGTGDALEINNTDGMSLNINNSGNDGSVQINQTLVTNPGPALEVNQSGTGEAIEINNTDGIGLEINNSGNDESIVVGQTLATSGAPAAIISNAGLASAVKIDQINPAVAVPAATLDNAGTDAGLAVAQLNPAAIGPAVLVDNSGTTDGIKVNQLAGGPGIHVDNVFGSKGIQVDNLIAGSIGVHVVSPVADGLVVANDQTVSIIGKVLGGGVDASAGNFMTIPNAGGPDATEPTLEAVNMVDGNAALFGNSPASTKSTALISNSGTGNALAITSGTHTSHALTVESEIGGATKGAASFSNSDAALAALMWSKCPQVRQGMQAMQYWM